MADTVMVSKWGNSLGVRIPKALAVRDGIHEGDTVEISIRRVNTLPTTLAEYLADKHWDGKVQDDEEIDFGRPVGEEIW